MPHFSRRTGAPSCRQEQGPAVWQGRSRRVVPCRYRLLGWLRNVARRSPVWGDVDIRAFCQVTGFSREHVMRELGVIRRESVELVFETKLRRKPKQRGLRWGVIVAERAKLQYDQCSLFYDRAGRYLHNRTSLGKSSRLLTPPLRTSPAQKRAEVFCAAAPRDLRRRRRFCDIAYKEEDYFVIQPHSYGAKRDVARQRESHSPQRASSLARLRKKAFSLLPRLASRHYDNCKVRFSRRAAFRYALGALADGHEQERIETAYEDALLVCHAFAVDRSASLGEIVFFNASSTVKKARERLAADGLSAHERRTRWYVRRVAELREIRAQIAATFSPLDGCPPSPR